MPETEICPYCQSDKVAKIFYGLPIFTEQLQKDLDDNKVVLGGCMLEPEDRICLNCNKSWASEISTEA